MKVLNLITLKCCVISTFLCGVRAIRSRSHRCSLLPTFDPQECRLPLQSPAANNIFRLMYVKLRWMIFNSIFSSHGSRYTCLQEREKEGLLEQVAQLDFTIKENLKSSQRVAELEGQVIPCIYIYGYCFPSPF